MTYGMPTLDLLDVAAEAAARLEQHDLVACGRRVDGVTRVDFWTRGGRSFSCVLDDATATVDEVVARCLIVVGAPPKAPPDVMKH